MAVAMVVNGRLFKVAATTCGLLLTVYALYVYREVTSELQQCGKDLSATHQQYKSAQSVITDLEDDAKQARSVSSACQNSYAKLLEESGKKKAESEQSIKKLTAALDLERKAKEDLMAEQDLRNSKCTSETQSLHLQLDTSQKKCSEEKNQMQNRLDEVISHSDIVDKQQQICNDDKDKLDNEKAVLKAQNDELMSKLKGLQQQVKTLLEKAKVPFDDKRGGSIPNRLSQSKQDLLPEKERRAPPPAPLSNADAYSVRKTGDPVRSDARFAPLGIQLAAKPGGSQRPTPITLPPVQGGDKASDNNEGTVVSEEKQQEDDKPLVAAQDKEKAESESQLSKREDEPHLEEKQDFGGGAQQAGRLVAGPTEGGAGPTEGGAGPTKQDAANKMEEDVERKDEEAEDPDRPHQYDQDGMEGGLAQLQQDLKGGALEAKSKAGIDHNDQS